MNGKGFYKAKDEYVASKVCPQRGDCNIEANFAVSLYEGSRGKPFAALPIRGKQPQQYSKHPKALKCPWVLCLI